MFPQPDITEATMCVYLTVTVQLGLCLLTGYCAKVDQFYTAFYSSMITGFCIPWTTGNGIDRMEENYDHGNYEMYLKFST
jgi:hypothetical protein